MATSADEKRARNQAYNSAETKLKEAHPQEWQNLVAQEMQALGLTYVRRLTPAEKARAQVLGLLTEFPELREEFTGPRSSAAAGVVGTSPTQP